MVLTPGEKVVVGDPHMETGIDATRLFFWLGALAFASVCGCYIVKELMSTVHEDEPECGIRRCHGEVTDQQGGQTEVRGEFQDLREVLKRGIQ